MESIKDLSNSESGSNITDMFKDFMARVAKIEEMTAVGSKLLSDFHQGLDLLRRPAIDTTSKLIESFIQANETERFKLYFQAGCLKTNDAVLNVNKSSSILDDLKSLLEDANTVIQTENEILASPHKNIGGDFDEQETTYNKVEMRSSDERADITRYASLMAVIYCNIKQDYRMQEKIVNALNLSSTPGELETYSLMWSLRPFLDDETMQSAWSVIPFACMKNVYSW